MLPGMGGNGGESNERTYRGQTERLPVLLFREADRGLHLPRQNRLLLYFGAEAVCRRQRVRRLSVWAGVSLHRLVYKGSAALYGPLERAWRYMTLDYYYGDQAEQFSFYRIEMSEMIATANAKSIEDIIAIFNNTAERFSF